MSVWGAQACWADNPKDTADLAAQPTTQRTPDDTTSGDMTTDNPWSQIEQFHNQMDQLFAQTFDQARRSAFSVPNIDLRDKKDHYEVVMDMPGAEKGTINVSVQGRILSVSGKRDLSDADKKDDRVLRDERGEASFERVVTLPGPVKAGAIGTTYTNGVLTINVPKPD
jgi:HSP20 family protein